MTIGANVTAIFVVPRGWIRKRRIRIAQVVPIMVAFVMSGLTTLSPWTAPRTDWAGEFQSQYYLNRKKTISRMSPLHYWKNWLESSASDRYSGEQGSFRKYRDFQDTWETAEEDWNCLPGVKTPSLITIVLLELAMYSTGHVLPRPSMSQKVEDFQLLTQQEHQSSLVNPEQTYSFPAVIGLCGWLLQDLRRDISPSE